MRRILALAAALAVAHGAASAAPQRVDGDERPAASARPSTPRPSTTPSPATHGPVWIRQRDRAQGAGLRIRLDDVADVDAADPTLPAALQLLDVAALPVGGSPALVLREQLEATLRTAGVATEAISWSGPAVTRVDVRPIVLGGAMAVDLARRKLAEALGADAAQASVSCTVAPEDLAVAPGRRRNEFTARLQPRGLLAGSVTVDVVAIVDDVESRSVSVTLHVRRRGLVAVATRDLRPGAIVQSEDLRLEERDLASAPAETFDAPEKAVGLVAHRKIAAGQPVTAHDV
ncbi:MAG TPA: SAF domain-containing protein, partial [Planctomycetota bacterium]|nr:SAF domain-containing protein [Planctomycetota bacterium]